MTDEFLTLSRQDLYELVWSKPMTELAADLGLSDVGLAKRCKKLGVPIPGRGYWARVVAGQRPRRAPLPKPADNRSTAFAPPPPEIPSNEESQDLLTEAERAFEKRLESMTLPAAGELRYACSVVQRLARDFKILKASEINWRKNTDRTGPTVRIEVSDAHVQRAVRLTEIVLQFASSLGWAFTARGTG
jgi:hypothetical protein